MEEIKIPNKIWYEIQHKQNYPPQQNPNNSHSVW